MESSVCESKWVYISDTIYKLQIKFEGPREIYKTLWGLSYPLHILNLDKFDTNVIVTDALVYSFYTAHYYPLNT